MAWNEATKTRMDSAVKEWSTKKPGTAVSTQPDETETPPQGRRPAYKHGKRNAAKLPLRLVARPDG